LDDKRNFEGEACNADGTLKEAKEIQWLYSPSDESPSALPAKRSHSDALDDGDEGCSDADQLTKPKKRRVSQRQCEVCETYGS
jgi:hypothetical protein